MKVKRFSKKDRESSEREFLRRRSKKNDKTASLVSYPATIAGLYGTGSLLGHLTRNRPDTIGKSVLIGGVSALSGAVAGLGTEGITKLGLDSRDYLKAKRLTDEELKDSLKILKESSKEKKSKNK
jgi:hypothetical protein